jgi:hypothetical protein
MEEETEKKYRIAQPGDVFLLLIPIGSDLERLQLWQSELNSIYGGQIANFIHITCQRFSPEEDKFEVECITRLEQAFHNLASFPIFTDKIIQFYAPYWGRYVLRWQVQETETYKSFRNLMDSVLSKLKCPSHFSQLRHASCTALDLNNKQDFIKVAKNRKFPEYLFTAKELLVSKLHPDNQFEILTTITLQDAER